MAFHKPKVLFLSTGNATRSLIAEGFLRNLTGDRFDVASAGVAPSALNPLASDVMKEAGIDISGQKPKSLAQSVKESFGYVIAICDTAKERSPIFPFTLHLLRWSIADPSAADGLPDQKTEVFRRVRDEIRDKVRQFIADTAQIDATGLKSVSVSIANC
jgi:arsenate reductase